MTMSDIEVVCDKKEGIFKPGEMKITCLCQDCAKVPVDKRVFSLAHFEQHAGKGSSKKPKHSIKIKGEKRNLGAWMADNNVEINKPPTNHVSKRQIIDDSSSSEDEEADEEADEEETESDDDDHAAASIPPSPKALETVKSRRADVEDRAAKRLKKHETEPNKEKESKKEKVKEKKRHGKIVAAPVRHNMMSVPPPTTGSGPSLNNTTNMPKRSSGSSVNGSELLTFQMLNEAIYDRHGAELHLRIFRGSDAAGASTSTSANSFSLLKQLAKAAKEHTLTLHGFNWGLTENKEGKVDTSLMRLTMLDAAGEESTAEKVQDDVIAFLEDVELILSKP